MTAGFARLEPATGRLRMASAGHPIPVVVPRPGEAWYPPVEPGPPLGAPTAAPVVTWVGTLPAGGSLILYTDGLIEHRPPSRRRWRTTWSGR